MDKLLKKITQRSFRSDWISIRKRTW